MMPDATNVEATLVTTPEHEQENRVDTRMCDGDEVENETTSRLVITGAIPPADEDEETNTMNDNDDTAGKSDVIAASSKGR
jgi:hypothetical protein